MSLLALVFGACGQPAPGRGTTATVEVIRAVVIIKDPTGQHAIDQHERLAPGSILTVAERAQAVLHHDGGARLLLDGGAVMALGERGGVLSAGRLWADVSAAGDNRGADAAAVELQLGALTLLGDGAGFEVSAQPPGVVVVRGEVAWRGPAGRGVIRAGERASGEGQGLVVKPITLWDDWTGGLGWPDPRRGGGRAGLAEVGARRPGSLGEARFPLTMQRLQVRARIEDELAITTVEQTFFNPADATLEGLYRVRIPEGAILSRFAIDRHGRFVDGYVKERETARRQYQAQVYEGSTHDPALLEWEAPGSYRARLYPLPPGDKRRVLFTYSEWLPPHGKDGALRTYRYPMGAAGTAAPLNIQEVDIEVDAREANADELRAGLGALLPKGGRSVVLQRTDYQPRADLVVELLGAARPADEARAYRVPHRLPESQQRSGRAAKREDDYVLIQTQPVPARDPGQRAALDLVLLVDVSAATDATHLAMARTLSEAVLRHLHTEDRVAVLGADLDLRDVSGGKGGLQPLTPELRERLLGALGRARTGGATDLGATLSAAAALLQGESGRQAAVVYAGDALPTVGELDLPALRERLERLPAPLRLYGVGIGADADLGVLAGLSEASAGRAFRVSDRAAAAEAALAIVSHLSRPAASRVTVSAGTSVDRLYPRAQQAVSVRSGEPLTIVARARDGVPKEVIIEGVLAGRPFRRALRVATRALKDSTDLRLRWSAARLHELMQSGVGVEAIAELGVRQNLITPYTSFYVPSEEEAQKEDRLKDAEEGRMGRREGAKKPASYAVRDESERKEVANKAGLLGLLKSEAASAPAAQRAPSAEEAEPVTGAAMPPPAPPPMVAPAPEPAKERAAGGAVLDALMDKSGGEAFGASGLGLRGTGVGGGGRFEKDARALNAPARRSLAPSATVVPGTPEVRGALDKEIIRRIVRRHNSEVQLCYERGLAQNAALQGRVMIQFTITPSGSVASSQVQSSTLNNPPVEQCLVQAVRRWEFPKVVGLVIVTYPFVLRAGSLGLLERPAPRHGRRPAWVRGRRPAVAGRRPGTAVAITQPTDGADAVTVVVAVVPHRPRGCSAAASLSLDERSDLWRERLQQRPGVQRAQEVWQDALAGCELPRWTDRRELLKLALRSCQHAGGPLAMVQLYRFLADAPEEQEFLRKSILGQVKTPRDLRLIHDSMGLGDEERATLAQEVVRSATALPERLRRLRELLLRWPQDLRLRLLRMETEELLGQRDAARRSGEELLRDPFADAQVRAAVGELLLRLGDVSAARRTFSEIVEFAPRDPLARRRLGDLYRAHGWFDLAARQYQTLLSLSPGDSSVLVLQALAAAGAGHVELALGLLERVTGTAEPSRGGEASEAGAGLPRAALLLLGERLALLREEARKAKQSEDGARLLARARRDGALSLKRPVRVYLTWSHPDAELELRVSDGGGPPAPPEDLWPQFGLLSWRSHRDAAADLPLEVEVRRSGGNRALPFSAELVVVRDEGQGGERLLRTPLRLDPDKPLLRVALRGDKAEVQ